MFMAPCMYAISYILYIYLFIYSSRERERLRLVMVIDCFGYTCMHMYVYMFIFIYLWPPRRDGPRPRAAARRRAAPFWGSIILIKVLVL